MAAPGKRPFWMHQLVEYILGIVLVAGGVQSTTPIVPSVLGGLVLLVAASTKSSVAAFRVLPRSVHRVSDPALCVVLVVGGVQPWWPVDVSAQLALIGVAVVYLFVWWQSDFSEHVPRRARAAAGRSPTAAASTSASAPSDTASRIGASMGRVVGRAIAARRRPGDPS